MIINKEKNKNNKIGSSETICETTFKFEEYKKVMPFHKKDINQPFLEYFVGLVEGSNALIVNSELDNIKFCIYHPKQDIKFLRRLRTELGFGYVSENMPKSATYEVSNEKGLLRIISILNGNLCDPQQQNLFETFLETFNKKYGQSISLKENNAVINLETRWLSGFIDMQGLFTARVHYFLERETMLKAPEIRLAFELSCGMVTLQKIRDLFIRKNTNITQYKFEDYPTLEVRNKIVRKKIINYIQKNQLRTFKNRSFRAWMNAHSFMEENKHQDEQGFHTLLKMVKQIR